MQENPGANGLITFLPLLLMSFLFAVVAHFLAKEKGRKVILWTVLGAIPIVNFFCLWFFVGAANLKLERKMDELLALEKARS
jgi:hypothetical protein